VQGAKAPSRLHSNVLPAWLELKPKLALVWLVTGGGSEPMVVSGAVMSIVQLSLAGVTSAFPAGSVAFTAKVCGFSSRPV
jgi:hypothetical protein